MDLLIKFTWSGALRQHHSCGLYQPGGCQVALTEVNLVISWAETLSSPLSAVHIPAFAAGSEVNWYVIPTSQYVINGEIPRLPGWTVSLPLFVARSKDPQTLAFDTLVTYFQFQFIYAFSSVQICLDCSYKMEQEEKNSDSHCTKLAQEKLLGDVLWPLPNRPDFLFHTASQSLVLKALLKLPEKCTILPENPSLVWAQALQSHRSLCITFWP